MLNLSVGHQVCECLPKAAAIVRPATVNGLHTDCYVYIIISCSSSSSSSSSSSIAVVMVVVMGVVVVFS